MEENLKNKFGKMEKNLEELLLEQPKLAKLENRKLLIWEYWKKFDNLTFGISKEGWLFKYTWPDYITRSLRKLLNKKKALDIEPEEREKAKDEFRETLSSKEKKQYDLMFK